jgi:hypothetical protein
MTLKFRVPLNLALTTALLSMTLVASQEASGARSMFYNPATGTSAKPPARTAGTPAPKAAANTPPRPITAVAGSTRFVGVHYWIDVVGRGPVADTNVFVSGDRIRLHVRTNVDGFLAVWSLGNSGKASLLLPVGGTPTGSPVKAGDDYVSPLIRFQPPAQDERLLIFFGRSKSDMPSLDVIEGDAAKAAFMAGGARDLVVETDEVTAGEVGTYVVNRRGGSIAREITLKHVAGRLRQ